jgi:hypothetical protein
MKEEDCIKQTVKIFNENFYLTIGDYFVDVTVPRENSPEQIRERTVADTLCRKITALMRLRRMVAGKKKA